MRQVTVGSVTVNRRQSDGGAKFSLFFSFMH